jgi:hypothetical protein
MIFCVYLLPASQQNHLGAFIGFISASHDSDVLYLSYFASQSFSEVFSYFDNHDISFPVH